MHRMLFLVAALLTSTCSVEVDEVNEVAVEAGGTTSEETETVYPRTEEDLLEEQRMAAEAEEIVAKLKAGEPVTEDEVVSDDSAYQRWIKRKQTKPNKPVKQKVPAWLRLARWSMSESPRDMEALLQLAYNLQREGEPIGDTIARRAPRVAQLVEYTATRQMANATLPAYGDEPPKLWWECESVKKSDKGHWVRRPVGCHGTWEVTLRTWQWVREKAKKVIKTRPHVIPGVPIDQGGEMDIWRVVEEKPYLCYLGQIHERGNSFFGYRDDPRNTCLQITAERVEHSKRISAALVKKQERQWRSRRKTLGTGN